MKTLHNHPGLLCLAALLMACSGETSDETSLSASEISSQTSELSTRTPEPTPNQGGAGFFHIFERSKFHAGDHRVSVTHLGLQKVIGSDGAFAVDPRNGSMRAVLNADSPVLTQFKPYTTDAAIHNAVTVDYFQAAGLPADQVAGVRALPSMRGGVDALGNQTPDEFVEYASIVYRSVRGIPVPDSFAWAIFNADGEVVQEAVHWPTIPDDVIDEAIAFQQELAAPENLATFKKRLPGEAAIAAGSVSIRHGSTAEADPAPFAAYDVFVRSRGTRGGVRHFDREGAEMVHPSTKVQPVSVPDLPKR